MARKLLGVAVLVGLFVYLLLSVAGGKVLHSIGIASHHLPAVSAAAGEVAWIKALLAGVGAPANGANVASIEDWITHETVNWPPEDHINGQWIVVNNPMNTGQDCCNGSSLPGVPVKYYPTLTDGLDATISNLEGGYYPDILAQLRAGSGLLAGASQGLLTWSAHAYSSV